MPQTRTCDFSGEDIEPGTGIMFVRNDGTVLHFKDSKAEKNYFMGREARNLEWTEAGQREHAARQQTVGSQDEVEQVAAEGETELDEPEPAETSADADQPDVDAAEAVESEGSEAPDLEAAEVTDAGVEGEPAAGDQPDVEEVDAADVTDDGDEADESATDADAADESDEADEAEDDEE
ncbi:50S ribosomal protein L24e [Halomarina ordinaria]|uniref:Large ribosomal subunit protein eL24 n=1 Tax=Halomarina ordinaria TaxID=3033939 RepID=A0ABD5UAI0_9EURY|nr:50S ribosomal protein L24e [Halomarina sp. PSRA2]